MCACVRTFLTCWEVLCAVDQTLAVALHLLNFFWSPFVNLLCRKPEIESLGFTCNWLVLVGRLAWTSAACTYFGVADKFTTAKRKDGTLYQILRYTQLSLGCCVGLAQLNETPAHRTAASLWLRSDLRRLGCTTEPTPNLHAPPAMFTRWQVRRSVHIQNKLFPQLGSWDMEFRTVVHNNISVVQLKTTKKYLQHLLVPLEFATAKSALYRRSNFFFDWVPSPPKKVGSSGQQTTSRKCLLPPTWYMVKANDDTTSLPPARACSSWKWNHLAGNRAGRRGGERVAVDCACSIWGIHIQTKSTFICGINGVGGGGGGTLERRGCSWLGQGFQLWQHVNTQCKKKSTSKGITRYRCTRTFTCPSKWQVSISLSG